MITSGLRNLCLAAMAVLPLISEAGATDVSAWDGDNRSGMRLIAGSTPQGTTDAPWRAGIELKLAPGWKTYWRYPGDSGVPPRFDFSRSDNVQSVAVLWPAPRRFADGAGYSIGYRDGVIFPLHVVAQDKSRPVTLRLNANYAICEKLCVPVDATAELALTPGPSTQDTPLAAAEASVPKAAALDDGKDFAIRSVRLDPTSKPARVIVDVTTPANVAFDLFAEGPTPEWALPLPKPVGEAPAGGRRFTFDLDGLPPGAGAAGAVLTLTAIAGAAAIEVKAHLD
jgi:DsbC/DsbD-like thiol-disulfide interchange protein